MKRKYGNKTVTVDGLTFDSELESRYYLHLKGLRDAGIVEHFEMQQQFELLAGYTIAGKKRQPVRFTPDFVVYYADGHIEVVDIKGSKTAVSRDFPLRKKLFETKFNMPLYVIGFSQIDGGWIELDDLDKASKTQRDNINALVRHHNADKDGLIVSGHLNAVSPKTDKPIGFEVLYTTQKTLAQSIADKVCAASGLKNRGAKYRDNVGVLTQTYEPAILIEFGFVNSSADVAIMDAEFENICFTIAQTLAAHIGYTIKKSTTHGSVAKPQHNVSNKIGYSNVDGANAFRIQSGKYTSKEDAVKAAQDVIASGKFGYVTIVGYKE